MGSVKQLAFGLLIAVLGGLAVLVTLEFIFRTTGVGLPRGTLRALHQLHLDRPWLFGLRPGARVKLPATGDVLYEINADGFRDRPRSRDVPDGHFRILVLGSSVTFGFGVEGDETYPRALESALAETPCKGGRLRPS